MEAGDITAGHIDAVTRAKKRLDADQHDEFLHRSDKLAGVATLFAAEVPEFCPGDPVEKNKFLAAHALARLASSEAAAGRTGRPEFVAVIDADA